MLRRAMVLGRVVVLGLACVACGGDDDPSAAGNGSGTGGSSGGGAGGTGGRAPGAPSGDCGSVRLTRYDANRTGWCEFPDDLPFLPAFVRAGMTAAIAEPWNNGSYEGEPGEACGECWEIDTIGGTRTVMISNLCPIRGNPLCAGSHFHLDLTSEAAEALQSGGLEEGHARRVACPVEGNIHIIVNDENFSYLRVAFMNHRIPIRSVEFRGAGAGVTEPNPWTPVARGSGAWQLLDDDRILNRDGEGVQFRLTSAQGQVVESSVIVDAHPAPETTFDLGVQFDDMEPSTGGSCDYAPPGDIYVDEWGGIPNVPWLINPWGEAELGFFGETNTDCFAGSCLLIEQLTPFDGFHLYYRTSFPPGTFAEATFRARVRSGSTDLIVAASNNGERCTDETFEIGEEWAEFAIDLATACDGVPLINGLTFTNAGGPVALLLDDVRFVQ